MNDIRQLKPSDLENAVEVQANAFFTDPLWCYLYPHEDKRQWFLHQLFRTIFRPIIKAGQVTGVGNPVQGIAVWDTPDTRSPTFSDIVQSGVVWDGLRLLGNPSVLAFPKALKFFNKFEQMKKQYATQPHFYLATISVHPSAQGQGLASKLIRPFLDKADNLNLPCYTETMTPDNV